MYLARPSPLRFGLLRRGCSCRFLLGCFTAAPTEQRQSVLGTEREAANGLFTSGAQSDVDPAVVGQTHGQQGFQDLLLFRRRDVSIGFDELLNLFGGHVLFEAKSPRLEMVRGEDRKSTRLNSSHLVISYAGFCLKKKK